MSHIGEESKREIMIRLRRHVSDLLWSISIGNIQTEGRSIVEVEHAKPSISNRKKEKAAAKEKTVCTRATKYVMTQSFSNSI